MQNPLIHPTLTHPLTGLPLIAVGVRKDGRPIWPVIGASEDGGTDGDSGDSGAGDGDQGAGEGGEDTGDQGGEDTLGDAGKRALAAEREARKTAEKRVRELQTAQQSQLDAIAKALGLKKDDETPDPAKLAEQVTAEQARAREASVQLAVYRTAASVGANPDALLDSASFLASLNEIDPSDTARVSEAVKAAVEKNPLLKAASGSGSASDAGIGASGSGGEKPDPGPGRSRIRAAIASSTK